jgi:carbonic anhydrase
MSYHAIHQTHRVEEAMVLDEILAANTAYVAGYRLPAVGHTPRRRVAVVTCMDTRLVGMFEEALGLQRGDVIELRTAGATLGPGAEIAGDLVRSLAGAIYLLGVREVLVIGHTDCGLSHVDHTRVVAAMQALGVDTAQAFAAIGGEAQLDAWLGSFSDVQVNTARVAQALRASPLLPRLPIHALVIDIQTGRLQVVERGAA